MPKGIYDRSTATPTPMPSMDQVQHLWTGTEYQTIQDLIKADIIEIPSRCESCGSYNSYRIKSKTKQPKVLRCNKVNCKHQKNLLHGTFFAEAKLSLGKVIQFLYLWLSRTKVSTIHTMTVLSSSTLADYG